MILVGVDFGFDAAISASLSVHEFLVGWVFGRNFLHRNTSLVDLKHLEASSCLPCIDALPN